MSPRGRIAAMRAVELEGAPVTEAFVHFMSTCVQCRGCEPACPSGVPYGHLQERVRESLAAQHRITPWWQRIGLWALTRHRLLLIGSTLLAVAQRVRLVPARVGVPRLALRRGRPLRVTGTDVWIYTGCVMDAWMRSTHRSLAAVLEHMGIGAMPTSGGCCGALHAHAGLGSSARELAAQVMASMPGDAPVLVDSAGCGAAMKDYGRLLGTPEAHQFAARVVDVHEYLVAHLDRLAPARRRGTIAVQDPCHLRHVQKSHGAVRTVLRTFADIVELDDDGLCCGAGGAYSMMEPELAAKMRDRKLEAIGRTGCTVVASANPGCAMHLAGRGLDVRHPIDLLAECLP